MSGWSSNGWEEVVLGGSVGVGRKRRMGDEREGLLRRERHSWRRWWLRVRMQRISAC
jgi:hypothetical protein